MIGGVTRRMLPHLSGVPHLHINRPLESLSNTKRPQNLTSEYSEISMKRTPQLGDTLY